MSSEDEAQDSDYEAPRRSKRGRPVKEKTPSKRLKNHFLEVEASSAEEDEESELDEVSDEEKRQAAKVSYELKRRVDPIFDPSVDAEKQAKKFEQMATTLQQTDQDQAAVSIAQRRLLPSIDDPKLWLVGCRRGKTQVAVINLMQKALQLAAEGSPLKIFSAFASSHLDDRIYVEAYQQLHVVNAIKGMNLLFENRMTIVPMEEMADVFAMDQVRKVSAKPGDFVRIKTGDYKGDLAQIWRLDEQKGKAVVKVVPRLGKTIGRTRPPPRLFNPQEYSNCERKMDSKSQEFFHYYNGLQFQDGFLFKSMSVKSLNFESVSPELAEVECFKSRAAEGEEIPLNFAGRKVVFEKGDKVRVVRGDMTNLRGIVISVTEDTVVMKPELKELDESLPFTVNDLVKCFDPGDHATVVTGRYKGHSGMVVSTSEGTAQLICDVTKEVFPALFQDMQLSADVAALPRAREAGNYRVNDVVTLSADKAFGLVVKVEQNSVRAVMHDGDKRVVRFSEISKKFEPRRSQAQDLDGNALGLGDMVRIVFSKHQFYEKTGAIRNCHAGTLFLYNTYFVATDGILPVKAQHCTLLGAHSENTNNFLRAFEWVGKLVSINNGPYRGQTGRVMSLNEKMVTIQLNSASKTITIDRHAVTQLEKGDIGMRVEAVGEAVRTPAHSPGWPRTPAYDDTSSPWRGTPGRDFARSPSSNRIYR